jgi:hypothetical protein
MTKLSNKKKVKQSRNLRKFVKKINGFFSLSLIGFVLLSCDIQFTDDHFLCASQNAIHSKQNNVFVEYLDYVSGEIITTQNDTLKVLECFIEYKHNIKHNKEVVRWDGMQLILVLNKNVPTDYDLEWLIIEEKSDYSFERGHKNSLMIDLDRINTDNDTLHLFVYEGQWSKDKDKLQRKISEIVFAKQPSIEKEKKIDSTDIILKW